MQHSPHNSPLRKEVPGHLFQFEEKIFGIMTLNQLLIDLGIGIFFLTFTSSLPLSTRIISGVLLTVPLLILVHGQVHEKTFFRWLTLFLRSYTIARVTVWHTSKRQNTTKKEATYPSIQQTWIPLTIFSSTLAGYQESNKKGKRVRYWAIFEAEGRNIKYLAETEQIRTFQRFETFLAGLDFRIQFVSHTEQVHPSEYPPLRAQQQACEDQHTTPQLAKLQQASVTFQHQQLQHCTITRHFIILSASTQEETARRLRAQKKSFLSLFFPLFSRSSHQTITPEQVHNELRIRCSVLQKACKQLDIRLRILTESEQLRLFSSCLSLGTQAPSFVPHLLDQEEISKIRGEKPSVDDQHTIHNHHYLKSIRGMHGTHYYLSEHPHTHLETDTIDLADLLSPSHIEIHPDAIRVEARGQKRYQRYFTVTGYAHQLECGWISELTELGLPMLISCEMEPLETSFMLRRLEIHLVKLESQRYANQKALKVTKADHHIEAEQVSALARDLAARRITIFAVSLIIGIHASDLTRLEQRSHYLLTHLQQKHFRVRSVLRQQEQAWQASLPTCAPLLLDQTVNLPSSVCSTFLHCGSGIIGTPTGFHLGFVGHGRSRRPVYFHPWSEEKKIPNPHMVVVGESGMGKSWLGKTCVSGLMGMGIADVVVLDRDDDYLSLHEYLGEASQCYNLARHCPINLFDLPFGPADVNADDPSDLLAEFFDHHLLIALALLVTDSESGSNKISKNEEAYLTQVARATYDAHGISTKRIQDDPNTLLLPAPTLSDFLATLKAIPASSQEMHLSLIERIEKALYLFSKPTSISFDKPLTIFSIKEMDEKWYPLATYIVQNALSRHRTLRRDERYLAYVVEEASYMLKHPAGRRYLESGSRGFRKLGIAQITLSQHPKDFLEEGAVVLSNAGTAFFLGMQPNAAEKLHLSPELERVLTEAIPGQAVMRCGNEFAAITVADNPQFRALFTTDPQERKKLRQQKRSHPIHHTAKKG